MPLDHRIEDLEGAIATALQVNALANRELNRYVATCDKLVAERDAWKGRATHLAKLLSAARKQEADVDTDEQLALILEASEAQARSQADASPSGMPVEPNETQSRVIQALISRGRAAGWLVDPNDVSAELACQCSYPRGTSILRFYLRSVMHEKRLLRRARCKSYLSHASEVRPKLIRIRPDDMPCINKRT
eukprot:353000-Chlamydomonas_euryale.AAC.19